MMSNAEAAARASMAAALMSSNNSSSSSLIGDAARHPNLVHSQEEFEDLLATNRMFVDYFNLFLANPGFSERLKYNFRSGDLELAADMLLDDDYGDGSGDDRHSFAPSLSTGERVRDNLETQLKSIIRNKKDLDRLSQIKLNIDLKYGAGSSGGQRSVTTAATTASFSSNVNFDAQDRQEFNNNYFENVQFNKNSNNKRQQLQQQQQQQQQQKQNVTFSNSISNKQPRRIKSAATSSSTTAAAEHQYELFRKANNNSFKELDLIRIEPFLDVNSLKNPAEYLKTHTPTLRTKYSVQVIRKPFSMKWLRTRRLALFLQSEFYNEFKLAYLLAQSALFNYNSITQSNLNEVAFSNKKQSLKMIAIKLNAELTEMKLNPFKSKNDIEKLREFRSRNKRKQQRTDDHHLDSNGDDYEEDDETDDDDDDDDDDDEDEDEDFKSVNQINDEKLLINSNIELYKSIESTTTSNNKLNRKQMVVNFADGGVEKVKPLKQESLRTSMLSIRDDDADENKNSDDDDDESVGKKNDSNSSALVVKSVNEMAQILVNGVISEYFTNAREEMSQENKVDLKFIEENYRYHLVPSRATSISQQRQQQHQQQKNASGNGVDVDGGDNEQFYEFMPDGYFQKKFSLEFDDEPFEEIENNQSPPKQQQQQSINQHQERMNLLRKEEIDKFKSFLKENDAFLFFKLWVEIERLGSIQEQTDQINFVKQLKSAYNKPQILSRINNTEEMDTTFSKKSDATQKYYHLYHQYANNLDFWSVENLTSNVQKKLLFILIRYWWPKYCIRMQTFGDYVKEKYPDYLEQHKLIENDVNRYELANNARLIEFKRDNDTKLIEQATTLTTNATGSSGGGSHNFSINRKNQKKKEFNKILDVDFNAENIAKSLRASSGNNHLVNDLYRKREEEARLNQKERELRQLKELERKQKDDELKRRLKDKKSADEIDGNLLKNLTNKKIIQTKEKIQPYLDELAQKYILYDNYKTAPPVGWKRPASAATQMLKKILSDNQPQQQQQQQRTAVNVPLRPSTADATQRNTTIQFSGTVTVAELPPPTRGSTISTVQPPPLSKKEINEKILEKQAKNRMNREIYSEAIYHDNSAGQLFMKFLATKSKTYAINRLKCLHHLIKYKELFYEDQFNQEAAKKTALEIYSRYIAVSASDSIDCPKADRVKLHGLFSNGGGGGGENIQKATKNLLGTFKPVYEDTFDSVEEFLFNVLYDDWKYFMEIEDSFFNHNQIESIERSVRIRSTKIDEMIRDGIVRFEDDSYSNQQQQQQQNQTHFSSESDEMIMESSAANRLMMQQQQRQRFNAETGLKLPIDLEEFEITQEIFNSYNLKELLSDTRDLEMFKRFLVSQNALNDLLCWMDIEEYSQIDPNDKETMKRQAKMLKKNYLNKKYFFSKNGPVNEETQNLILEKIGGWAVLINDDVPSVELIKLAQKHLEDKIKLYWLPYYLKSKFYKESKFINRTKMVDVVDDVLYLKNQKSKQQQQQQQHQQKLPSKIKNQRWLFTAQMIMNFSKSLRNSFTVKVFGKFLTLKSPLVNNLQQQQQHYQQQATKLMTSSAVDRKLEAKKYDLEMNDRLVNDLNFLVEVQDYKDLCQRSNEDERSIYFKLNHIIDCYINNRISPKLRIDISNEIAREIMDTKDYQSPYLFLKAYLTVFDHLMPYWLEFDQMRSKKDLELFDEFSGFKKMKDMVKSSSASGGKSGDSTKSNDDLFDDETEVAKWRQNQYIRALKAKLAS